MHFNCTWLHSSHVGVSPFSEGTQFGVKHNCRQAIQELHIPCHHVSDWFKPPDLEPGCSKHNTRRVQCFTGTWPTKVFCGPPPLSPRESRGARVGGVPGVAAVPVPGAEGPGAVPRRHAAGAQRQGGSVADWDWGEVAQNGP